MTSDEPDAEAGQVMLLMIFLAVVVAGLITVIVDVSTVFLAQREMQSTADGAALAASQQANLAAIYAPAQSSTALATIPLEAARAKDVANTYSTVGARMPHECSASTYQVVGGQDSAGNERTGLQADGTTVRVELTCKVPLPFLSFVASAFTDGVTINQVAYAQSAVSTIS